MAMTVFKFPLAFTDVQEIEMPAGAIIIKVDAQRDRLCLWAWCNPHPKVTKKTRRIAIVGTGHPAPIFGNAEHIGSVLITGVTEFVWHVFELRRAPS